MYGVALLGTVMMHGAPQALHMGMYPSCPSWRKSSTPQRDQHGGSRQSWRLERKQSPVRYRDYLPMAEEVGLKA